MTAADPDARTMSRLRSNFVGNFVGNLSNKGQFAKVSDKGPKKGALQQALTNDSANSS